MTEALTIGVVPGVTPDKWLRAWRERMPEVPLHVVALEDRDAGAALTASGIDMVFVRLPLTGVDPGDVHVIPLWEETPMVVAGKDHPVKVFDAVTLADLADEEVYPGWDDATLDIVAAGHGVARMPQAVYRATGRRDVVAREISDAEPTRIALAWWKATSGALVDEFIGIVRGRTTNSSRGVPTPPAPPEAKKPRPAPAAKKKGQQTSRGRSGRTTGRRH